MKAILWFLLGAILAVAGQTWAQSWGSGSYQSQTETNTLNNFNNSIYRQQGNEDQQRNSVYSNPYAPKSPC